jgi:hypothetical protein
MIQFLALAVMQEKVIDRPAAAFVPALASSAAFAQEPASIRVAVMPEKAVITVTQLFRNRGAEAQTTEMRLGVNRMGEGLTGGPAWTNVRWADQPIALGADGKFPATIPAKGWASLKATIDLPLAAFGPDRIQRGLHLDLPAQTLAAGGSLSMDFRKGDVLRLIAMEPSQTAWKYTLDDLAVQLGSLRGEGGNKRVFVSWWRGGFAPIGDGS